MHLYFCCSFLQKWPWILKMNFDTFFHEKMQNTCFWKNIDINTVIIFGSLLHDSQNLKNIIIITKLMHWFFDVFCLSWHCLCTLFYFNLETTKCHEHIISKLLTNEAIVKFFIAAFKHNLNLKATASLTGRERSLNAFL